jgi:hypothetical protein
MPRRSHFYFTVTYGYRKKSRVSITLVLSANDRRKKKKMASFWKLRLWPTKYRRNRVNIASFVRLAMLILKGQWA